MSDMSEHDQVKWAHKIAALLKKAESTTPEEAEALTARAEQLMIKFNIDSAVQHAYRALNGKSVEEKIVEKSFTFTGTYHRALLYTFVDVATALGFKVTFRRGNNWSSMMIMGFESDVTGGELIIASLQLQLVSALNTWWKTYDDKTWLRPMEKFKSRRSFMFAFGEAVCARVYLSRRNLIADAEVTHPGTALAVRTREQKLADAYEALGVRTVKVKQEITDYDAYIEGYRAGENSDTGDKQVVNERRSIEA
jgi:hypothetical protein